MSLSKNARLLLEKRRKNYRKRLLSTPKKGDLKPLIMDTSESRLMWDVLEEKVKCLRKMKSVDAEFCFPYPEEGCGDEETRTIFANFLMKFVVRREDGIDFSDIYIQNGATAILEMLGWSICDDDEYLVIPNPYFPGFIPYFGGRTKVLIKDAPQDYDDKTVEFQMNFDTIREKAMEKGVRGIVLCNPHNPIGTCYSKGDIQRIIDMCVELDIHLISDEVYANSRIINEDTGEPYEFTSVYSLVLDEKEGSEKRKKMEKLVHVVYAMSKDYGVCGLRVGMLLSKNKDVLNIFDEFSDHQWTSQDTVYLIKTLLTDDMFFTSYINENFKRLTVRFQKVLQFFDRQENVKYVKPQSGMFIWFKLTFIESYEQEKKFFEDLLDEKKLLICPGYTYHTLEPGWFRIVITSLNEDEVFDGLERVFSLAKVWVMKKKKKENMVTVDLTLKNIGIETAKEVLRFLEENQHK